MKIRLTWKHSVISCCSHFDLTQNGNIKAIGTKSIALKNSKWVKIVEPKRMKKWYK